MKKIIILLLLIPSLASTAELVDRIVAIVGDQIITHSDVKNYSGPRKKDPLEQLIRERLFKVEVERLGVEITGDDLASAIGEVLSRNRLTLDQLKKELTKEGKTFEEYKQELRKEIRRMKFLGQVILPRVQVSEEDILKKLGKDPTEEERIRIRRKIVDSRLSQELDNYLDEVRKTTYVEIKKR